MYKDFEIDEMAPWMVFIITLIGGFLRVFLLGSKGLWLDETFSIWVANHSVADLLQWVIRIDQHPPLYYLLLHYWIGLNGDTAYYTRLLSALFGTATIPIIYLIGKRISGAVTGLAAALFLSVSLFNIYYAQETRMYTLLTFNAAVAIYALARLLTDPRAVRPIGSQFREYLHAWRTAEPVEPDPQEDFSYQAEVRKLTGWRAWVFRHRWLPIQAIETDLAWVALVVFSAATLLSHNTAVFFILAINIFVLGLMIFQRKQPSGPQPAFQAPSLANWVKAQIGIFLLWSPWLLAFFQQASKVDQAFWIPTPTWDIVIYTLRSLLNPSAPGQAHQIITWILCAVIGLGLVYFRKKPAILLFLVALFAIPVLGELVVSIRRPIFYERTLIWITIPLFLVLAAGVAQLRFQLLIFVAMVAFGANFVFSNGDYYRFVQKEDWSGPAGYVSYNSQKDDLILFNSPMVQIPFDYYFRDYEAKFYLQLEKHGVPDMFDSRIPESRMTNSELPRLISLLRGHNRVWLVYSHNSYTDPQGLIPQTLASQMKLIQQREFYGSQVQLYGTP